jgi:hypothetical protein
MHVQTHILSGWCIANCFRCTPRQRLFAMIAASAADVDGISIVFGYDAYMDYHHTFGHNVFAACIVSAVLAAFTKGREISSFFLFVALFHLHFLMDYYGSGRDWHIHYIWPMKSWVWRNPDAWDLYSWQNMVAFGVLLVWTIWIARAKGRTPLEAIMPKLDRELAGLICKGSNERQETST